ncbi:hypothetical protein FHG89_19830 [Micromonospora orduensis]|uniref:Uncharacterized protein n=1 Tax=Micromonospora orduensis TaxID=1420891 RepID=A0A5C4QNP4_9ACTN|nr:HEPN domain-containing protein [Micromonospora orduensis]TNH26837.1 hypothetical protein FHG89_19830 [Micromonospora orduensis]
MTDDSALPPLKSAIAALMNRARDHRDALVGLSDAEFLDQVAGWPETHAVNTTAAAVARAHGYMHHERDDETDDLWGRRLTRRTLDTTGVSGMLRQPALPDRFAADLAGYLAGPAISSELLIVIDASLPVHEPHEVAGWQLAQPTSADLDAVTPLPSTRPFASDPWDPALRNGGCCILRRRTDDLVARNPSAFPRELLLDLFEPELTIPAWEPLLLLNLAQPERVTVAAEYELEPRRMVERTRGTGLDLLPTGYDGNEEWEEPAWGPCRLDDNELGDLLAFTDVMSPLLTQWQAWEEQPKADRKRAKSASERLRRSAYRFLALGPRLGADGDALYERDRAEIVFWYVSALENLLITDSKDGDFSRKVSQRIAVLVGADDDERLEIRRTVARAYAVRSTVAHGDLPPDTHLRALPHQLRSYLRLAFRNLIILGPLFDVAAVCDDALMSAAVREQHITGPIQRVVRQLSDQPRRRP